MISHYWENWLTASELAKELNLSKRRVQQILKFYLGLGIINMNIMVRYPDDALRSKVFTWSTYAAPIYKCKHTKGFVYNDKEKE